MKTSALLVFLPLATAIPWNLNEMIHKGPGIAKPDSTEHPDSTQPQAHPQDLPQAQPQTQQQGTPEYADAQPQAHPDYSNPPHKDPQGSKGPEGPELPPRLLHRSPDIGIPNIDSILKHLKSESSPLEESLPTQPQGHPQGQSHQPYSRDVPEVFERSPLNIDNIIDQFTPNEPAPTREPAPSHPSTGGQSSGPCRDDKGNGAACTCSCTDGFSLSLDGDSYVCRGPDGGYGRVGIATLANPRGKTGPGEVVQKKCVTRPGGK